MPVTSILGVLACLYLMVGLPWTTWQRLLIWLVIGMAVYIGYGHRNAERSLTRRSRIRPRVPAASDERAEQRGDDERA
jgi:APA family basic amino acid/polyamine antiporter